MSNDSRAVVAPQSPTPFLFSNEVIEKITADEAKGIYTAERCPDDKRKAIIQLVGRGWTKRRIQETLSVHRLTIIAVQEAYPEDVDAVRQRTVRRFRRAVEDQLDRVEESPGLIPANSIPMFVGVLTDKAELLDGRATARVESVERVDIFADWDGFLEKTLAAEDVTEIPASGIGLTGGKKPAIEVEPASGERLAIEAETDGESEDRRVIAEGKPERDPTCVPISIPNPDPECESGPTASGAGDHRAGGGSAGTGLPNCQTGNSEQKILPNRSADR